MFIVSIFLSLLFISGGAYAITTEYYILAVILIFIGILIFTYAVYERKKNRKKDSDKESCVNDFCGELSCQSLVSGFNKLDCDCDGIGCDCSP